MALAPANDKAQKGARMELGSHRGVGAVVAAKRIKKVQVALDEAEHTAFKMACIKHGTDMSTVLQDYIKVWMQKHP